jgi:hypothetical protein
MPAPASELRQVRRHDLPGLGAPKGHGDSSMLPVSQQPLQRPPCLPLCAEQRRFEQPAWVQLTRSAVDRHPPRDVLPRATLLLKPDQFCRWSWTPLESVFHVDCHHRNIVIQLFGRTSSRPTGQLFQQSIGKLICGGALFRLQKPPEAVCAKLNPRRVRRFRNTIRVE